jgi:DnaJ-class molecular chaperone
MASGPADDYYALLGIDASADDGELRRAWRRLALRWHPDHAGPTATATFQKISVAYAVLSDPAARAAYDQTRNPPARSSRPGSDATGPTGPDSPASAPPPGPRRRAPGVMLSRLTGPLNALLARRVARHAEDHVIELFLEPDEAAQGGMIRIAMRVPVRCTGCAAVPSAACAACEGRRVVEDVFSAWLAVPPDAPDGTVLHPSARLPGMIDPVSFRVRLRAAP